MKPTISGKSRGRQYFRLRAKSYASRSYNKYPIAHQGQHEQDRRRRQIERGQLKAENGLIP